MTVRSRSTVLAALLCAAVVAGCSQVTAGTAASDPADGVPPALLAFYTQKLSWGACGSYATNDDDRSAYADPSYQCARLTVPLDYATPTGPVARIGVLRRRATGPDRIGSLVVNPGGPGASGMSEATALATEVPDSPLLRRFDLVGFDPRGVASSTPAIECLTDAEWTQERLDVDVDPSPAGVARTEAENRQYAQRCTQRTGAGVLADVGTRDVARDLDVLRAVLGDAKLTYLGYSYGTRIGSTYAEDFPQKVRALVLDGALDPKETTVDRTVAQNAGFQQAFDAYAADCATNPACPLGTDPAKATAAYQALTRPLIDKPLPVGNRMLSWTDAQTGTILPLYSQDNWPTLSQALTGLAAGNGRGLLTLADIYYDRSATGTYDNEQESFVAIGCVDEQRITDRSVIADEAHRAAAAAPFLDSGRGDVAALDPCAFWPVPPTSTPHEPQVSGLPPTLVISTTGDPATPYQAGVNLAKDLAGSLLTFRGTQHTVALQGKPCVDDVVESYLIDLQRPAAGTTC